MYISTLRTMLHTSGSNCAQWPEDYYFGKNFDRIFFFCCCEFFFFVTTARLLFNSWWYFCLFCICLSNCWNNQFAQHSYINVCLLWWRWKAFQKIKFSPKKNTEIVFTMNNLIVIQAIWLKNWHHDRVKNGYWIFVNCFFK